MERLLLAGNVVTVSREMEAVWGLVGAGDFEVIQGLF